MRDQQNQLLIAVIGDVHDRWEVEDNLALEHLGVDLALFVGDFGNESVEIVRTIASLKLPKAVILGNHDAWYTASDWGKKKAPYDHNKEDRVQQQLDLLGKTHVGYGRLDFPEYNLSVVGSRPFSWGGAEWKNHQFYRDRYQVNNFTESTTRIVESVASTPYNNIIFIGHNAPTGLGSQPEDICGKDWNPLGGDHGDPDFEDAIAKSRVLGKFVSLVTFGHMHHRLRHRQDRLRTMINSNTEGTVYLNAACVPRIKTENNIKLRNFSLVTLQQGVVNRVSLVWVDDQFQIASQEFLPICQ